MYVWVLCIKRVRIFLPSKSQFSSPSVHYPPTKNAGSNLPGRVYETLLETVGLHQGGNGKFSKKRKEHSSNWEQRWDQWVKETLLIGNWRGGWNMGFMSRCGGTENQHGGAFGDSAPWGAPDPKNQHFSFFWIFLSCLHSRRGNNFASQDDWPSL